MATELSVSVGHYSDKGRKAVNQDSLGWRKPDFPTVHTKGIALAIADGISSSEVSDQASQAAIQGFLDDYYCSAESWSVKKSALQSFNAINAWLYRQNQKSEFRFERDKGYVCTFSALILKSTSAHWFHLGDCRTYLFRKGQLTQLTEDHREFSAPQESHLSRALGIEECVPIDSGCFDLAPRDVLLMMTDGIYEYLHQNTMISLLNEHNEDLDICAAQFARLALEHGSDDNLSIQIIRIEALPDDDVKARLLQLSELPLAPLPEVRQLFDGYHILQSLHASSRSHVYLAKATGADLQAAPVVIKMPSIDLRDNPVYLERFLQEEWIARRLNNPHVLKPYVASQPRQFLYTVFEYIEGQTLSQWMQDNPSPSVEKVRQIIEQIAIGLGAFHRLEMLHQDLRPHNIMIDQSGIVKIIDFGSTRVAGLEEIASPFNPEHLLGTAQYAAPEYFLGEAGTERSDLFSLAVITYQMLSGRLPYGANVAKARSKSAQQKLRYQSVLHDDKDIPTWIDHTLKKALQINPEKRHEQLSEFVFELRQPSKAFLSKTRPPLMERNPLAFWQGLSLALLLVIVALLARS